MRPRPSWSAISWSAIFSRSPPRVRLTTKLFADLPAYLLTILAICLVLAMPSHAETITVRGIVQSEAEATISSELVARVIKAPYKPGDAFDKGADLLAFDCSRYTADLQAAEAEAKSARLTLAMNQSLHERRAIGAHDLAIAAVKLDQAEAQVQATKVRTDQCVITAPFKGQVVERLINQHEMPQSNAPLLKIVKTGDLELGLIIPSHWLVWLRPGVEFQFTVEETATIYTASIKRIGAVVDPISRTVSVVANLLNPSSLIRPGMSGTAAFTLPVTKQTQR